MADPVGATIFPGEPGDRHVLHRHRAAARRFPPVLRPLRRGARRAGILRYIADKPLGYPCRITLRDAAPGETLLLANYEHQPADTPFRSRHAIFVGEQAAETARYVDEVPPSLAARPYISLRAFDDAGMMTDGQVAPGSDLAPTIEQMLAADGVAYLHAHYAGRGCYAARIDRA